MRQWKQGVRRITLELPGGMINEGETAAEAGARELREETGYAAPSLHHLGSFDVDASKAANQGHAFLAVDAELLHEPEAHEMESPEVVLVALTEIPALIDSGEVCGGASVAALLQALRRLGSSSSRCARSRAYPELLCRRRSSSSTRSGSRPRAASST